MTPSTLELVALCLYDHGPLTLNEISLITCLPLPTLRTHLHLNHNSRYQTKLTFVDGMPKRTWELAPTIHPPIQETDE